MVSFLIVAVVGSIPQNAQANEIGHEGNRRVIATNCVCKATGEIIGYANDCGAGDGACVDSVCTQTTC